MCVPAPSVPPSWVTLVGISLLGGGEEEGLAVCFSAILTRFSLWIEVSRSSGTTCSPFL